VLEQHQLQQLRAQFPFYENNPDDCRITYLDNAATTQKPAVVIDCLNELWSTGSANVHRSSHSLANRLTERFEQARDTCRSFINAEDRSEIVWTSGTTEAINLVANSWGISNVRQGDQILVTAMEHHANLLPWQQLCQRTGAELRVIPILQNAELDLERLDAMLNARVKLLAISHVSNVLGTINPLQDIIKKCHSYDCKVLVDGAQAIAHLPIDVQRLDCDFYTFSGHKCYAPEGTGVLYGKKHLFDAMSPWKMGGEMVKSVSYTGATYQAAPVKFEAGTPNISGIIALAEALKFISSLDQEILRLHETDLTKNIIDYLHNIKGIDIHSNVNSRNNIISMSINDCQSMDIAALLDEQNIAIRSGHLCAMPLVKQFNPNGVLRASFAFYNSEDDVEKLLDGLMQSIALVRA